MEVILRFKFLCGDTQHHAQKRVHWYFSIFPEKGDCLSVDDIEDTFGELEYANDESKKAISGNIFPFVDKMFLFNKGKPIIELYFAE